MIFNLGSINADYFYTVPHLPRPGETLAAVSFSTGLGGKGANMSVAAALAGSEVRHIGAIGADGTWAVERLSSYGVNTQHIEVVDAPTGHAIIQLEPSGENAIVLYPGANVGQFGRRIEDAISQAGPSDTLLLQNETNLQGFAAETASRKGMRVAYAAAPYETQAVSSVLPYTDILILNEIEMAQLQRHVGKEPDGLGVNTVIVTKGASGCTVFDMSLGWQARDFLTPKMDVVDTTGAGDTFTGYLVATLDQGFDLETAVRRAIAAAALKVTRKGTADAIPSLGEVLDLLG